MLTWMAILFVIGTDRGIDNPYEIQKLADGIVNYAACMALDPNRAGEILECRVSDPDHAWIAQYWSKTLIPGGAAHMPSLWNSEAECHAGVEATDQSDVSIAECGQELYVSTGIWDFVHRSWKYPDSHQWLTDIDYKAGRK